MEVVSGPVSAVRLGVLLVHGIGEQHRGDTLVHWLDSIVATVNSAQNQVSARIDWADLGERSPASADTPAHALVRFQGVGIDETWMVAEAFWAQAFSAPSFAQLVTWGFRGIPWAIAMHVAQQYQRWNNEEKTISRRLGRVWTVTQLLAALAIAPFLVLAMALLLLIGLIPVDAIRQRIGAVQRSLAASTGDSLVFLESPVTAAAICSKVIAAFTWLRARCESAGCDRTVILAHSQGAAVALEALGRMTAPSAALRNSGEWSDFKASALVTFGAGINKLAALRSLAALRTFASQDSGDAEDTILERDPIRIACVCLLGAAAVGAWFWRLIGTGQITLRQLWLVPAAWFGGSLLIGLTATAAQQFGPSSEIGRKVMLGVAAAIVLVMSIGGIVLADKSGAPVMPFILLFMLLVTLNTTLRLTLSSDIQSRIAQSIAKPANVESWVDYWASADPVPNGPTTSRDSSVPVSTEVWNEASLTRDHTTYWENRDGFVLPVVRTLAEKAQSGWRNSLLAERKNIGDRSRWRSRWLTSVRWLVPAIFLLAGSWGSGLDSVGQNLVAALSLPKWLSWVPLPAWKGAFRWTVVALCAWTAYRILLAIWHEWVRREQDRVLQGADLERTPTGLRLFALAVTYVAIAAIALARSAWTVPRDLAASDVGGAAVFLLGIAVFSQIFLALAMKVLPPPGEVIKPPGQGKESASKTQAGASG